MLKDIQGYEGRYAANENGEIYSYLSHKFLTPCRDGYHYFYVNLIDKDGKRKSKKIHRIIAETFLPNPNNLPCVNHKDCNPSNNALDNLEWCDYHYNNTYGERVEKIKQAIIDNKEHAQKVKVVMCDKDTLEPLYIFDSIGDAARYVKGNHSNIVACLNGRQKTSYGYKWQYYEENNIKK